MKIAISYFISIIVTCSSAFAESKYNFSTDTFQLGQWSPKTLSFEQGLRKIKLMDDWFYRLPTSERQKVLDDYVVNRNRLFIVTQEKRMTSELQPTFSDTAFGVDAGVKEVKRETSRQRATLMVLFLIGIVLELFKIPLGGTPEVAQLASRLLKNS